MINPSIPAKTLPEFIAYAKANPGKINYASFGIGSAPNMTGELLKLMAGIDMVHVPYRQSPVPDLLSGQVQAFFGPMPITISLVKSGKLRALAVSSAKRSDALPDVPAVAELSTRDSRPTSGTASARPRVRRRTSSPRSTRRSTSFLPRRQTKEKFANIGGAALGGTPEEYGKFIASEVDKWAKVIKAANIKPVAEH